MCTIGTADSAFITTRTELPQAHIRRTQQWARVDVSDFDKHIEGHFPTYADVKFLANLKSGAYLWLVRR
jgi:hypothetical protein